MTGIAQRDTVRESDKADIRDLLHRFSRAVDRKRWADIPTLATGDARFDYGTFKGGLADLLAWMEERHENVERSFHSIGSMLVEFAGDRALCESYVISSQRVSNPAFSSGQMDVLATGRYVDIFRKEDVWRLEQRHFALDNSNVSEAPTTDAGGMRVGRRDETDILWIERARLGLA